eukprot:g15.t1
MSADTKALQDALAQREARVAALERQLADQQRRLSSLESSGGGAAGGAAGGGESKAATWADRDTRQGAKWVQPAGRPTGIKVSNSLLPNWACGCSSEAGDAEVDLVDFIPKQEGEIKWYICGPTVYDSAHIGHARAYLTFDILRSILENYFGFNIQWVMNITDIDDKIILRARQNYLVDNYLKDRKAAGKAAAVDQALVDDMAAAQAQALEKANKQAEPSIRVKRVAEAEALGKAVEAARAAAGAGKGDDAALVKQLLEEGTGKSALGELLDRRHGATVTDKTVFEAHARYFEMDFFEDMEALGVRKPDVVTRVTEYVPQIVTNVEQIIGNGFAYHSNGSVYFDTRAFKKAGHLYPKLVPGVEDDAVAEAEGALASGGDGEKKHPHDFALWKKSKDGEPRWESPWGLGRPGWHIECSVMASDVIGENMDVHAGGVDLRFPHHDNEMAQAEGCFNTGDGPTKQWVNYFLHAGHLNIDGLKMSKSLKNFISIKGALTRYTGRQLRMLFLQQQWDRPMSYSEDSMESAVNVERRFNEFFQNVRVLHRQLNASHSAFHDWGDEEKVLYASLEEKQRRVRKHLSNNFDTASAMIELQSLLGETTKYMKSADGRQPRYLLVLSVAKFITHVFKAFGLAGSGIYDVGFGGGGAGAEGGASKEEVTAPILDAFVGFRDEVRNAALEQVASKDMLGLCDQVRDTSLIDLGVRLEDHGRGQATTWKMEDPKVLKAELERKKEEALRKQKEKEEKAAKKAAEEAAKLEKMKIPPQEMFKADKAYSKFDDAGMPTHTAAGEPMAKSQLKKLKKQYDKQKKEHDKYLKMQAAQDGEVKN